MKKPILFAVLFVMVLASVAAILQSGWTSTTVPSIARTALGVPGLTNNNAFTGSNYIGAIMVTDATVQNLSTVNLFGQMAFFGITNTGLAQHPVVEIYNTPATNVGTELGAFKWTGTDTTGYVDHAAALLVLTGENWTPTNHGALMGFYIVTNGSTVLTEVGRFDPNIGGTFSAVRGLVVGNYAQFGSLASIGKDFDGNTKLGIWNAEAVGTNAEASLYLGNAFSGHNSSLQRLGPGYTAVTSGAYQSDSTVLRAATGDLNFVSVLGKIQFFDSSSSGVLRMSIEPTTTHISGGSFRDWWFETPATYVSRMGLGYYADKQYSASFDYDLTDYHLDIYVNQAGATSPKITVLSATGNVGIGTIVPTAKLDVAGAVRATTITLTNAPTFNTTSAPPAGFVVGVTVPATWYVATNNAGARFLFPGYTP